MLKVGFVVTPEFPLMSLAALSVFEFANLRAPTPLYDVRILSEHGGTVATSLGATVETVAFGDIPLDTLIIGGNVRFVPTSPALRDFVVRTARTARRVASICTGVFALADAGVLDGRRVTTHWLFTDELRAHLPGIRLDENRIFIVDGAGVTAAGNSAGIDLTLAMLEADHGVELARIVARVLVVEYRRAGGQTQQSALLDLEPKSDRIQIALAYARRNLRAPLSVESLAEAAGLGPRQFSRTFRAETGISPAKAIESLRLEAARLMLEQSRHPINVIAAETGFGDAERMRRAFIRSCGRPPQAIWGAMPPKAADAPLRDGAVTQSGP